MEQRNAGSFRNDGDDLVALICNPNPKAKEGETAAFLAASTNTLHFSEILCADGDFHRRAKISIFGATESFFETLFML
jgi:hypothetical protein